MTPTDLTALKELAARFRRRAEASAKIRDSYEGSKNASVRHRCEGKRQAYSNAADDLERVIREVDDA